MAIHDEATSVPKLLVSVDADTAEKIEAVKWQTRTSKQAVVAHVLKRANWKAVVRELRAASNG